MLIPIDLQTWDRKEHFLLYLSALDKLHSYSKDHILHERRRQSQGHLGQIPPGSKQTYYALFPPGHHSLMDGLHVGRYFEALQERLNALCI